MEEVRYLFEKDSIVAYWPRPSSSNVLEGLKSDSLLPRERIVIDYLNRDSCVTHGYIYELLDGSGNTIGWLPMDTLTIKPAFEYTVLSRDTLAPVASVNEEEKSYTIKLYPNPSNQKNTIEFVDAIPENTTICLYDITGRRIQNVFSGEIQKNAMIEVDISMLSSGIYLYSISNSSMKTNLKFIKN